ncbi:MAG: hypothetical protein JO055_18635 [Alphaproteobacteria bacterium]|nr:hypothetical protein [Alphaproteobacteria bacterium]
MPRTTPRLTSADLTALHDLASGGNDITPVSRYWLSVYELIDETPQGWQLTERGREFLREPSAEERFEAVGPDDPRVLSAAAAAAATSGEIRVGRRRRRRQPVMDRA